MTFSSLSLFKYKVILDISCLILEIVTPNIEIGDRVWCLGFDLGGNGGTGRGGRKEVVEREGRDGEDDEVTSLLTWRIMWHYM